ncbi:MAG: chromosome partitioning protein [Candidatus Competibacteraceae bacterium]|nr:MAG: chromosome partitioning protein [Candidatus Competibacteraceae bacterium]
MIILIGGEKGGTGKTTLAVNLAALRALHGRDVLLIDTDIQASASYWAQIRDEAAVTPRVACIQKFGKGLQTEVRDLATRYQDLIIDAGGRDSVELRSALVVAERAFVPIQPSQFDIWTLGRMDDLVKTAQGFNPDLHATVVISRASTHPSVSEVAEARGLLADFAHLRLSPAVIRDRIAYRKAARDGMSVAEQKPTDPKAGEEMQALFREVFDGE